MQIDTTIGLVAVISGFVGALFTAYLNYKVRDKIKKKELEKRKRDIAFVHFMTLADFVAGDFIVKEIAEKLNELYGDKDQEFELSHKAAAYLSKEINKLENDKIIEIEKILNPFISMATESIKKIELSPEKLADLPNESIFFYNRYVIKGNQFVVEMKFIEVALSSKDVSLLSASTLHSIWMSFKDFCSAVGLLRASLKEHGRISDDYSSKALLRSYNLIKEDMNKSLQQSQKLEKTKDFIEQSLKANNALAADS